MDKNRIKYDYMKFSSHCILFLFTFHFLGFVVQTNSCYRQPSGMSVTGKALYCNIVLKGLKDVGTLVSRAGKYVLY